MKLSDLKPNPENPFPVKGDEEFEKLVKSLREDPEFLKQHVIAYDSSNDNMIIGGNKRHAALVVIYGEDADCDNDWFEDIAHYDEEKKRRYMFKDNKQYGEWSMEFVSVEEAATFDISLKGTRSKDVNKGEVEFSEYINEENNYVVLIFNNRIDWVAAMDHFNLKSVSSRRSNGKPWSKGIGRVVNGADYLARINEELEK